MTIDYEEVKEPEVMPKDNRKSKMFYIVLIVTSVLALIALLMSGKSEPKKVRVIKKTIVKTKSGKKKAKTEEEITEEDDEINEVDLNDETDDEKPKDDENDDTDNK